jgi:catechol 2,3-dioxygenase-like lactoylglutathione lyase family enzyme
MDIRTRARNGITRSLIGCVVATLLVVAPISRAQTTQAVQAVVKVGVTVDDMDRSVAFFTSVLDFKRESDVTDDTARTRVDRLKLGGETIELTDYLDRGGKPIPPDSRSNDRWFQHIAIVTTDIDAGVARLNAHHVHGVSQGPQRLPDWNKNAAGIRAFYFNDPDNHVLEIIQFPPGKGDPKWQGRHELFAGIDHTAIVVADTDRSLAFYRDRLGLRVAGGSENYGIEQERLNNIAGAHLRITTLRAATGPGIELLQYLDPSGGRAYPADARAQDLFHWQTTLAVPSASGTFIADPDGHVMQLVAP